MVEGYPGFAGFPVFPELKVTFLEMGGSEKNS